MDAPQEERPQLVKPEGTFGWAELEIIQSALRMYQAHYSDTIGSETLQEFVNQLESKFFEQRRALLEGGQPITVTFLPPKEDADELEEMVTAFRVQLIEINRENILRGLAERHYPLHPHLRTAIEQQHAQMAETVKKAEEQRGEKFYPAG